MGTIVNVIAIIVGGLIGLTFGKILNDRMQQSLLVTSGLMTLFIGIGGVMEQMLKVENGILSTSGTMMMILSLLIGTIVGEIINLDEKISVFGEWLKKKTGNAKDAMFTNGFVTASLTVCIGAMAIVGSIQDGILHDHSILFTKAILDFIILIPMSASLGKGAMFSFISVGLFQGIMTLLASLIAPLVTDAAMSNISYVGSILIFAVGVNLIWPGKIKVANMLPSLLVAFILAFLF